MGMNIRSCCHRCKERVFHYRGDESKTIMPFYYRHRDCLAANPGNVETREDQYQEEEWMRNDEYKDWIPEDPFPINRKIKEGLEKRGGINANKMTPRPLPPAPMPTLKTRSPKSKKD